MKLPVCNDDFLVFYSYEVNQIFKKFTRGKWKSTSPNFLCTMFIFENISAKIIFRCLGLNFRNYLLINYSSFWYKKISSSKKRPKKVKKRLHGSAWIRTSELSKILILRDWCLSPLHYKVILRFGEYFRALNYPKNQPTLDGLQGQEWTQMDA